MWNLKERHHTKKIILRFSKVELFIAHFLFGSVRTLTTRRKKGRSRREDDDDDDFDDELEMNRIQHARYDGVWIQAGLQRLPLSRIGLVS